MIKPGPEKHPLAEYDNLNTKSTVMYHHTRTQTETILLVDYAALNYGALNPWHKTSRPGSVFANLRTLSSVEDREVAAHVENVPKEVVRKQGKYAHTQKQQSEMIRHHQQAADSRESIKQS